MTDRLADLTGGRHYSDDDEVDIEAGAPGVDDESNRLLEKFNREVAAIDKVTVWANGILNSASPSTAHRGRKLQQVEEKMKAVRKRLKNMADTNAQFAKDNSGRPATVRTRIVRYTKCSQDFMSMTEKLASSWEDHRTELSMEVKRDVMSVNTRATEAEVDHAINNNQLESVLVSRQDTSEARHQLEDIRERNKDIQKLVKSVAELNQIFQDMSILVNQQQDLINNIEYTVQEVKSDTKVAAEELVQARAHQKSKRKKKICICVIIIVIIIVILIAVLIPVLRVINQTAQTAQGNGQTTVVVPAAPANATARMAERSDILTIVAHVLSKI